LRDGRLPHLHVAVRAELREVLNGPTIALVRSPRPVLDLQRLVPVAPAAVRLDFSEARFLAALIAFGHRSTIPEPASGFARTNDGGTTWSSGYLTEITKNNPGTPFDYIATRTASPRRVSLKRCHASQPCLDALRCGRSSQGDQ
jgi:hypothetical protein